MNGKARPDISDIRTGFVVHNFIFVTSLRLIY
jgi:hypothetical protein